MGLASQTRKYGGHTERHWFHQMEGYLQWKVIAPDYNNPFKPPVPEYVLRGLIQHRSALRKVCALKCFCEGFELMSMDNLETPSVSTDHPCISALGINKVLNYVSYSEVFSNIEQQLDRISKEIQEILEERAINSVHERDEEWGENVTLRELRQRRERKQAQMKRAADQVRVRYQNSSLHSGASSMGF